MDSAIQVQTGPVVNDRDLLTMDDLAANFPVQYDALVLHAVKDEQFVNELNGRMKQRGFRLLTTYRDNLRMGEIEQSLMCRLITNRCKFIIIIYSKAFFESLDEPINEQAILIAKNPEEAKKLREARKQREIRRQNRYYADYVHADKIASKTNKMIPCVYKEVEECELPEAYRHNFMLYVHSEAYNFYDRLAKALTKGRQSRAPVVANGHAPVAPVASQRSKRVGLLHRIIRWSRHLARRFTKNKHEMLQEL